MRRALLALLILCPIVAWAGSTDRAGSSGTLGGGGGGSDGLGANGDKGPFTVTGPNTATLDTGAVGASNLATGAVAVSTSGAADPVNGSTACNTGDIYTNTTTEHLFYCDDGDTDHWTEYEEERVFCYLRASQGAASDDVTIPLLFPDAIQIVAFACFDTNTAQASVVQAFTVQLQRQDNTNQIGSGDATCAGRDGTATWVSTAADADGALAAGKTLMTDVTEAAPNPASTTIAYCVAVLVQ